jgi:hypothetical protein
MKSVVHSGVACLLILLLAGAAFSAPIVFGIRNDHVVHINASTGETRDVGGALGLFGFSATTPSAFDPVSRTLFLACRKSGDSVNRWWWKIDMLTGEATRYAVALPSGTIANQYFYDPTEDLLYGLRGDTVMSVNPDTGRTKEGDTYTLEGVTETTPATYDPLGNILYVMAADSGDGQPRWWRISTALGAVEKSYLWEPPADGLQYDIGSRSIYGIRNDKLVAVDPTSGQCSIQVDTSLNLADFNGATPTALNPLAGRYYISGARLPSYAPTVWNVAVDPPGVTTYAVSQTYALYSDYYTAPTADAGISQTVLYGDELTLDASQSTAIDAGVTTYAWDLDDDGEFETETGSRAIWSLAFADLLDLGLMCGQTYTIRLQVTDAFGEVATDWAILTIVPEPATLGLLIAGAVALLVMHRRLRSRL